jgi:phosphatidylinositol alpha-1,6-mannosyltransferase
MKDNNVVKTLLITENFPPKSGGSGRWFWELYSRLPHSEYSVLAGEWKDTNSFDVGSDLSISRYTLSSPEWGFVSLKGILFYIKTVWHIRKQIKQQNITNLHCGRVLPEGVMAWILNLLTGIPYSCYVHGEDLETAASSREQQFICKQVIKRSTKIICNSQNSASLVAKFGEAARLKALVFHPGVDSNKFVPAEPNAEIRSRLNWLDKKVLLTVGRLQARKGQDMMIKALPDIKKNIPNIMYAVVGDGECLAMLQNLAKEHEVEDSVQFLHEVTDQQMIECYQQCDLFILPNRTIGQDIEGFGMVLVEAQSCAKPVIAGDSGGTKETMLLDESGLIVDATQQQNIVTAVVELLADEHKLKEMGKKGREHVLQSLDWKALVFKAKELFS